MQQEKKGGPSQIRGEFKAREGTLPSRKRGVKKNIKSAKQKGGVDLLAKLTASVRTRKKRTCIPPNQKKAHSGKRGEKLTPKTKMASYPNITTRRDGDRK